MISSFNGDWATSPDACKIGKRMIDLCRMQPRSHHCFWLGIADTKWKKMHRAFILGLPVMNEANDCIVGVEMRIVHKASIQLSSSKFEVGYNSSDLQTVAQWMVR